jgi:CBS domain-containing protein
MRPCSIRRDGARRAATSSRPRLTRILPARASDPRAWIGHPRSDLHREAGTRGRRYALGEGEFFPVGALIGRRPTTNTYRAETDTFCWELGAADFRALLERSARFRAFCTDHLAALLGRSQRSLRAEAGVSVTDAAGMLAPLRSVLKRAPVACAADRPLGEVLRTMHEARIGSMIVVGAHGVPVGIFTTADVLRTAASRMAPDTAIGAVMTRDPVTLEAEATLADAALAMARHAIRHVVVTRDGKLAGIVSERDLFALQRIGLRRTSGRVHSAANLSELIAAAEDIRALMRQLLAQGVGTETLTAMISALNDAVTRRAIELAAPAHELPEAWCWLALGSEGRMEQTFATDQDNALIFREGQAPLSFADEVNRNLDAAGFPLCKGDVMARNPRWCLSARDWHGQFDRWIRNYTPEALLNASIFFDFRPLAGDARLAGALREHILAQTRANPSFCRAMAQTALAACPPLGLLSDFSSEELDLKLLGARPFVDAARVLALAAGSPETGTAARLRAAGERTAVEAFFYVQTLRVRRESNRVRVAELNDIDRRILKAAFRQAMLLQSRLRLEYQL